MRTVSRTNFSNSCERPAITWEAHGRQLLVRSSLASRSILDANLRQRFGVIVVGIQRRDLRMEFNPEPETTIDGGDKLVVLGRPDSLKDLEAEAGG